MMARTPKDAPIPIEKNYWRNLFFISVLVFAAGTILSAVFLLVQLNEPSGSSYGENFSILANLRRDLLHKSLIIYTFALVCISIGMVILTLLYSHRVVGPVFRLTMVAKGLASGNFAQRATLRKKDVLWSLAGEITDFITYYSSIIRDLKKTVGKLNASPETADQKTDAIQQTEWLRQIAAQTEEIDKILTKLKT